MRLRRRIFCTLLTLLTLVIETSVLPFTGLNMGYVPRVCLVCVILIGTILGATQGMIYGALAGILIGITVYPLKLEGESVMKLKPAGIVAITYIACALSAGYISHKIKPALVTVIPPLAGYALYELSMLAYYYLTTSYFPFARLGQAGIRLALAMVLVQLFYIPGIKLLKPASIGRRRR